jgi:hypothetical protein
MGRPGVGAANLGAEQLVEAALGASMGDCRSDQMQKIQQQSDADREQHEGHAERHERALERARRSTPTHQLAVGSQ